VSDPGEVEEMGRFHEEVARLPVQEREVVGLLYYNGWSQAAAAELLGVTVRTVQRWWQSALVKLHTRLKEEGGRGRPVANEFRPDVRPPGVRGPPGAQGGHFFSARWPQVANW
jgi:predicted DNA-binding protein (UPF0251 family)